MFFRILHDHYLAPVIVFIFGVIVFPLCVLVYGLHHENERVDTMRTALITAVQENEYNIYIDGIKVEQIDAKALKLEGKDVTIDKQQKRISISDKEQGFFEIRKR